MIGRVRARLGQKLLCCGAVFLVTLDLSLSAIALPSIQVTFSQVPVHYFAGMFVAYNLLVAVLLLPAGSVADRFGHGRTMIAGLFGFAVGCVQVSLCDGYVALMAGRVVQALGVACMIPASLALMLSNHGAQRNETVALWGAMAALAAALGPLVGGLLLEAFDWRGMYLVSSLCAMALVLGCCVGLGLTARQRDDALPFIDWAVFGSRNFVVSACATLLFVSGFSLWLVAAPLFLARIWEYSGLAIGLGVLPGPLATVAFAPLSARLAKRFLRGQIIATASLLCALGLLYWWRMLGADHNYWLAFAPGAVLLGSGVGLGFPLLTAAALHEVPLQRLGSAAAGNTAVRQLGMGLGAGLAASWGITSVVSGQALWLTCASLFIFAGLCSLALERYKLFNSSSLTS